MVDVKAREKQIRERLAELESRLHRIEDHLEQHSGPVRAGARGRVMGC